MYESSGPLAFTVFLRIVVNMAPLAVAHLLNKQSDPCNVRQTTKCHLELALTTITSGCKMFELKGILRSSSIPRFLSVYVMSIVGYHVHSIVQSQKFT